MRRVTGSDISLKTGVDYATARKFYGECGYRKAICPDDFFLTASMDGKIVGVVRLSLEEGVLVLRGMHVSESHRRKGIGKVMLEELDKVIGERECWGISMDYLDGFYGRIGFVFVEQEKAPAHLRERMTGYLSYNETAGNLKRNRIMFRAGRGV